MSPELKPSRLSPFTDLFVALRGYECNRPFPIDAAVEFAARVRAENKRVMFIGNGGSAGIASHMATDWLKNGGFAAMCFNDGAQLTCISNDISYAAAFALPIMRHGREGDLLFAISSSGQSENILSGVQAALNAKMTVVTLSGFKPDNPLRKMGAINFYVPSSKYGVVEVSHLAILHAILDEIIAHDARDNSIPLAHYDVG